MAKKRASAADAMMDIAPPPPRVDKVKQAGLPERSKKRSEYRRYGKPATYRLPEELIEKLKKIADRERVGISELATFVFQSFVRDYEAGELSLPKSEPARYSLDLD